MDGLSSEFIIDLVLTMLLYMGPLLIYRFVIVRNKIPRKKARTVSIISGVSVYILISVIYFAIGINSVAGIAPAVVWTFIAYWLIRDEGSSDDGNEEQ